MKVPRLRVFAGPNGSGKSTLVEAFSNKYSVGYFLNADKLEHELATQGFIDLNEYGLDLGNEDLNQFLKTERAKSLIHKSEASGHRIDFEISHNVIVDKQKETHSYEGALISAFLRQQLMTKEADFSFETVMSHPSKINEIKEAKSKNYKTYLYFICIDDPEVNISRVENRVKKGGHAVSDQKIKERYVRTLESLMSAIEISDKTYLFDNSGERLEMIAKIDKLGLEIKVEPNKLPNWFISYVLKYYQH